jgi:hypothetical protein
MFNCTAFQLNGATANGGCDMVEALGRPPARVFNCTAFQLNSRMSTLQLDGGTR